MEPSSCGRARRSPFWRSRTLVCRCRTCASSRPEMRIVVTHCAASLTAGTKGEGRITHLVRRLLLRVHAPPGGRSRPPEIRHSGTTQMLLYSTARSASYHYVTSSNGASDAVTVRQGVYSTSFGGRRPVGGLVIIRSSSSLDDMWVLFPFNGRLLAYSDRYRIFLRGINVGVERNSTILWRNHCFLKPSSGRSIPASATDFQAACTRRPNTERHSRAVDRE